MEILIAIAWFVGIAGVANILQYFFSITYQKNYLFFTLYFCVSIVGIYFTTSLQSSSELSSSLGVLLGIGAAALYVSFLSWWGRKFNLEEMYAVESVPKPYRQLLKPNTSSAVVKLLEIIIQDLVLLVIVISINQMMSYGLAALLVSLIVFTVHIPSPFVLGKVYGTMLMVLATLWSLTVPYVIGEIAIGFYLVFILHILTYMLLLVWSLNMQKWQNAKL